MTQSMQLLDIFDQSISLNLKFSVKDAPNLTRKSLEIKQKTDKKNN